MKYCLLLKQFVLKTVDLGKRMHYINILVLSDKISNPPVRLRVVQAPTSGEVGYIDYKPVLDEDIV